MVGGQWLVVLNWKLEIPCWTLDIEGLPRPLFHRLFPFSCFVSLPDPSSETPDPPDPAPVFCLAHILNKDKLSIGALPPAGNMYDILFICEHCENHLSADENDVGATFPCPGCGNDLVIPVGDILFECPACSKSLLAGKQASGHTFHCPNCQKLVRIPLIGKAVPVSAAPAPAAFSPAPVPPKQAPAAKRPESDKPTDRNDDQRFMATWGDYLAEAGLTDEPPSQTLPSEN
jgi:predicted RNA-binding Zn-ribbon protein involved in translation (DUF1610 family)